MKFNADGNPYRKIVYIPATGQYSVSFGKFNRNFATLDEAIAARDQHEGRTETNV